MNIFPNNTTKGAGMSNVKRSNEPQSSQTGVLATLANLLRARGTSAPSTSFANGSSAPAGSPNSLAAGRSAVRRLALLTALASFGCLLAAGPAAAASEPEPWWHLTQRLIPSEIEPGGEGVIVVQAINLGNASTSGRYEFTDHLPPGLTLKKVEYFAPFLPAKPQRTTDMAPLGYCTTTTSSASCSNESPKQPPEPKYVLEPVAPYEFLELRLKVKDNGAEPGALNEFTASGGGATPLSAARPVAIGEAPIPFGLESFRLTPEEEGGATATRAGSHPYQLTTDVTFNRASPESFKPPALPRNLHFKLPPGQIGNALITPQCSDADFAHVGAGGRANECPADTAIGATVVTLSAVNPAFEEVVVVPVFNLTPAYGEPARFGFEVIQNPVILDTSVRSGRGEDYGVTVTASNITQIAALLSATTTFWGAPAAQSHDSARSWGCLQSGEYRGDRPGILCEPANTPKPSAFLTLPTDCAHPFNPLFEGISWPNQAAPGGVEAEPLEYNLEDGAGHPLGLTACNQVPFAPRIKSEPTSNAATSPHRPQLRHQRRRRRPDQRRRPRPVPDQESRRHPARRLHHQPLGRRRAEGLQRSPVRIGDGRLAPGRRLPERIQHRLRRSRKPAGRAEADRRPLRRQAGRKPLPQPAHPLPGGAQPRNRHRRQTGAEGHARPQNRPADHRSRQRPRAALQPLPPQLPLRPALPADHPAGLWHLHGQSRPLSLVQPERPGPRDTAPSKSPRAPKARAAPPAAPRPSTPSLKPAPSTTPPAPTPPSTPTSPGRTPNRRSPTSQSSCRPGSSGNLSGIPECSDAGDRSRPNPSNTKAAAPKRKPTRAAPRPQKSATPWSEAESATSWPTPRASST